MRECVLELLQHPVAFYYVARAPSFVYARDSIQDCHLDCYSNARYFRGVPKRGRAYASIRRTLVSLGDRGQILKNANGGENVGAFASYTGRSCGRMIRCETVCDGKSHFQGETWSEFEMDIGEDTTFIRIIT